MGARFLIRGLAGCGRPGLGCRMCPWFPARPRPGPLETLVGERYGGCWLHGQANPIPNPAPRLWLTFRQRKRRAAACCRSTNHSTTQPLTHLRVPRATADHTTARSGSAGQVGHGQANGSMGCPLPEASTLPTPQLIVDRNDAQAALLLLRRTLFCAQP